MTNSHKPQSLMTRLLRVGLAGLATVAAVAGSAAGCLDRPVSPASPNTTNVFVQDIQQSTVDKIDILFMIDNSISMADKQEILGQAVPQLVSRLLTPTTDPVSGKPEFKPVGDIHIGVITSSLGSHGGDQCAEGNPSFNPTQNDNGKLVGTVRPGLNSYNGLGFLWWDANQKGSPPGETVQGNLEADFTAHVQQAGETGCGYEASLEAWYRFLIDPAPPISVTNVDGTATINGPDETVKQQRLDFLRPDSLVAVIMLSDENDCSIVDGGQNWIASQIANPNNTPFHLPRATSACKDNPNGECCRSCASQGGTPGGCTDVAADPECQKGGWDDAGDHPNLRCYRQRQRFGLEFLYPTRRYVEALTQPTICPNWDANGPLCQSDEERVANPLFGAGATGGATSRDPNLVYLAGIVGVPWQDIATEETLNDPAALKYQKSAEIAWDWLIPQCLDRDDSPDIPRPVSVCNRWNLQDEPDDPLMIESSTPRSGTHPRNAAWAIQPETAGELANPINGHEWLTADADLQYACIFKLGTPKDCSTSSGLGCDCDDVGTGYTANNPLCQGGGTYTKQQDYAKAFPGTRELQVLRDFGANSIVASICPKISTGSGPGYGYNPAVDAIIERLKEVLSVQCINRPVAVQINDQGEPDPQCAIVEVLPNTGSGCPACDPATNRFDLNAGTPQFPDSANLINPVLKRLGEKGVCGPTSANPDIACNTTNFCMCGIGFALDKDDCLNSENPSAANYGWCYVDPAAGFGTNPAVVADCTPPRLLRFVGSNTPASSSTVFMACLGKQLTTTLDGGP